MHNPGIVGTWGCAVGNGSQDLLHKAFQVFTDPGDSVLIDTYDSYNSIGVHVILSLIFHGSPAYSGTLGFLGADSHNLVGRYFVRVPIQPNQLLTLYLEVLADAEGLDPKEVERVLCQWPNDKPRPRVLYTVPTGSNPTGRSCSQERKIEM